MSSLSWRLPPSTLRTSDGPADKGQHSMPPGSTPFAGLGVMVAVGKGRDSPGHEMLIFCAQFAGSRPSGMEEKTYGSLSHPVPTSFSPAAHSC